ncbi:MAG: response regulator [Myxococcales bacterium]|nr:response regulator [Myxococcales bacterium]
MDDDPDMRSVFMRSFRYTQAAIDVAESPMRAIEMATSTDYCVVITELPMPGMSGLELVRLGASLP